MDPLIDEQASQIVDDELPPHPAGEERPWQEPEAQLAEEDAAAGWQEQEPTGMAGSGMPEAAGQAENPGTDTDIPVRQPQKRLRLDRV
jgi:hypothetical protein